MNASGRTVTQPWSPGASAGASRRVLQRAPRRLRLKIFLTRERLDRQLAAGSLYDSTALLELRASQLESHRERRMLARQLRRMIDYSDRNGERPLRSAVQIHRPAVRAGKRELLELAAQLEGPAVVGPRGLAQARLLITDRHSPLFNPAGAREVVKVLWRIQEALEGAPAQGQPG